MIGTVLRSRRVTTTTVGHSQSFKIGSVTQCDREGLEAFGDSIIENRNLNILARFTGVESQRAGCGRVILSRRRRRHR